MDDFYRNNQDLETHEGVLVESGSLFRKEIDRMILVNDDLFVEFPYNEALFRFVGNDIHKLED